MKLLKQATFYQEVHARRTSFAGIMRIAQNAVDKVGAPTTGGAGTDMFATGKARRDSSLRSVRKSK